MFTRPEKRNIILYIAGIVFYKISIEMLNVCVSGILQVRFGYDPLTKKSSADAAKVWTGMQAVNLLMQMFGSLLVGPLIKKSHSAKVLSLAILGFALVIAIVPLLELIFQGGIPAKSIAEKGSSIPSYWASWNPLILFAVFGLGGIFHGIVELMRRVIPVNLVGGDNQKLNSLDSIVHIFNEIFGTLAALTSPFWISYFGWGYSLFFLVVGFSIASLLWRAILPRDDQPLLQDNESESFATKAKHLLQNVSHNLSIGAKLVCSQRALVWLLPAYTLPLILHRYLENTIFPLYAKNVLKNSDLQAILTGGSNFGELMGAVLVLLLVRKVKTPIPYLRADAILILLVWVLPFFPVGDNAYLTAWKLAPFMALISFGWSCGDVSLAAYIQSRLQEYESGNDKTSPLAAVMSFLYVMNLGLYFVINIGMGAWFDYMKSVNVPFTEIFAYIAGVVMTACGFVVFAGTFIPRGASAWNPEPDQLYFEKLVVDYTNDSEKTDSRATIVVTV
jgi:hypothetical protein